MLSICCSIATVYPQKQGCSIMASTTALTAMFYYILTYRWVKSECFNRQ